MLGCRKNLHFVLLFCFLCKGFCDVRGSCCFFRDLCYLIKLQCGSSSVGRVSASQAECREFESRLPLHIKDITIKEKSTRKSASCLKFATAFHF